MKMKINTSRKFVVTAFVSAIIVVLLYAVIAGIYFTTVKERNIKSTEEMIGSYVSKLEFYKDPKEKYNVLINITQDDKDKILYHQFVDPRISVILFERREDGTGSYRTRDSFLNTNRVNFSGRLNDPFIERIGGIDYVSYEMHVDEDYYAKFLSPLAKIDDYYVDYGICLLVVILVAGVTCAFTSYFQGKPIIDNMAKQKEFINDMSHEIRTPLTVVKGNLENILTSPNSTVLDMSELIENSIREIEHIASLSQNLLNIVSDNRNMVRKKITYSLSDTVTNVIEVYSDIVSGSNKTLVANIDTVDAICDLDKIKQLLIILIDNAVKYTEEGDKIKVQLKRADNGFYLIVSDTGIGIAEGEEEQIFERFYRASNAKKTQGTGLGLSIAKSIVASHEGKIDAARNAPRGLIVTAYIPNKK